MKLFDSINSILSTPFSELRSTHLYDMIQLHSQISEQVANYKSLIDEVEQGIDEIESNTAIACKLLKMSDILTRAQQKLDKHDAVTELIKQKKILNTLIGKKNTIDWRIPIARDQLKMQNQII